MYMKKLKKFVAILTALAAAVFIGYIAIGGAHAQAAKPTFRLCTGNETLNYYKAGHHVRAKSDSVNIEVVPTKGSIDNLDKVTSGECDGAFVQSDAMLVYSSRNAKAISSLERAGILYQEHVHLLCNRSSGIDRVVDLTKSHTLAVGPDGSGARTTWEAFVIADKKRYSPVNLDSRSGLRAISAVADGSQVQCALVVAALNSSGIKNDAGAAGDRIVLVGTDDGDMKGSAKDARGQSVYTYGEIPAGTYPKVQPSGTLYGTKAVKTTVVDALFVANTNWISNNEQAYDKVLRAFAAAKPSIQRLVEPQN